MASNDLQTYFRVDDCPIINWQVDDLQMYMASLLIPYHNNIGGCL